MRPGVILGLALALYCAGPARPAAALTGDFNQDQRLDEADLKLLQAALGSSQAAYDLSGDGRVDLEDFFRWADLDPVLGTVAPAPDSTALPDSAAFLAPALPGDAAAVGTTPGPAVMDSSLAGGGVETGAAAAAPGAGGLPPSSLAQVPANGDPRGSLQPLPAGPVPPSPADSAALPQGADSTAFPPAAAPGDTAAVVPLPGGEAVLPDSARPGLPLAPSHYALVTTRQTTTVWLTGYTVAFHNNNPFGITSLRLAGQPVDFVHPTLPLGDWEWFWFSDPTLGQAKIKLLEQAWQAPEVARSDTAVVLRFRRQDVLRRGVEVEVAYYLDTRRPEFTAEYTVHNHSGKLLIRPYMMVGFPGFANQQWVAEVATAEKVRRPQRPYADFLAEAKARQLSDYLLLRQDWDPEQQPPQVLQGAVVLRAAGHAYSLHTSLAGTTGLQGGYIAHTNKPRYLTSHLYAFFSNIGQGQSQRLAVRYVLSRDD